MAALWDFLAMGEYGAYVWSAYGITFLVLLGLFVWTMRTVRRRQQELDELERTLATAPRSHRRLRPIRRGDDPRESA